MNWHYQEGTEAKGPVTQEQFDALVRNGTIRSDTLVWNETLANWQPYSSISSGAPIGSPTQAATLQGEGARVVCSVCHKDFPKGEVIKYGDEWVCPTCKPIFLQRLKEGRGGDTAMDFAGVGTRLGAKIIDNICTSAVYYALMLIPGLALASPTTGGGAAAGFGILTILVSVSLPILYGGFMIGKYGATLGKMATKIKVVNADGSPVGYGKAFGRAFAEILSGLLCSIGYLMAIFDAEKRTLHDRICNTRVVKK